MQEGISHEACAYAGHLGLGKLIAPGQSKRFQRDFKEILKLFFSFKQLLSSFKILKEAFYDDNGITIDGHTDLSFTEDVGKRFEGYGWQAETQCQKLCY